MIFKNSARMLMTSFVLAASYAGSVQANAPLFLWDNQEGVTAADMGCQVKAIDKVPFRVSQYYGRRNLDTENLRNYNGVRQSHLVNFSLLKVTNERSKRKYTPIEVIGVNKRTSARKNRWFSERGDRGYLYDLSLRPVEDFVFKVNLKADQYQTHAADYLEDLKHDEPLYLRVASGVSYYKVDCPNQPERNYTVFRAYQRHFNETAMFYLGVSSEETEVFADVSTYGKLESMSFLAEVGKEARISVDEESLRKAVEASEIIEKENEAIEEAIAEADDLLADIEATNAAEKNNEGEAEESATEEDQYISSDYVVCIGSRYLNVRDQSLEEVLFKAKLGESVKLFQSWSGDDTVEKVINGVKYNFKRVQFSERESEDQNKGFVASAFIKKKSDCRYLNRGQTVRNNPVDQITGLDDPRCCDFPTAAKPTHSYISGMRRFGGNRSGGRKHAACDLYRYLNEPVRSVAPGKVIHDLYYFYLGTYAVEVVHQGGFVVRYGELTGKKFVRKGKKIKMGDRIGNIGQVQIKNIKPMLHFELYSGSKKGKLTVRKGRYQRRSDLMDPTPYLLKWQDKVF